MEQMEDEFDLAPEYEDEMEEEGDEEEMFEPMGGEMPSRFEEEEEGEDEMMGHYGQQGPMSNDDRGRGKISSFDNFKKHESTCSSCNCQECECGGKNRTYEAKKAKPDFLDLDKDGDKKETMKKAAADKKKGGKEADKKSAQSQKEPQKKGGKLSKAQEKLPEGLKKAIKAGVRD
jgi:hypothetical protein